MWKEAVIANFRYCPGDGKERLIKTMKNGVRATGFRVDT
jgi:hypothetical protein